MLYPETRRLIILIFASLLGLIFEFDAIIMIFFYFETELNNLGVVEKIYSLRFIGILLLILGLLLHLTVYTMLKRIKDE